MGSMMPKVGSNSKQQQQGRVVIWRPFRSPSQEANPVGQMWVCVVLGHALMNPTPEQCSVGYMPKRVMRQNASSEEGFSEGS